MKTLTRGKTYLVLLTMLSLSFAVQAANFVDIATSAGLNTNSRSAGWADYNGDGCIDVMESDLSSPTLYRNNCDSTFTDVTVEAEIAGAGNPWGIVWADYDGDGDLDVYVSGTSSGNINALWRNKGDGTFEDVAAIEGVGARAGSAGASWADYDRDGDLDLFVSVRFNSSDNSDFLYRNDNGVFTDVSAAAGVQGSAQRLTFMGIWFDYDMDGDQDLYLTIDFGTDILYQNNNGIFTDVSATAGIGAPEHGMGVYTGDLNNDGCPDVVSSNNNRLDPGDGELDEHGPSIIYLNNCDGTFEVASYASGIADRGFVNWGVNFIDYDNDGDLDFSEVAGGLLSDGEANAFYENDGTGHLFNITDAAGVSNAGSAFGSSWVDMDNDGDLDWLVSNSSNDTIPNALFRNDSATGHYLRVKLNGADKNTDAVGAVVKITSGSRTQMRTIQAGLSYGNSEELVAHFGVGIKDIVDSVKVSWPRGGITELTNIAVDQTLIIDEENDPVLLASVSGMVTDSNGIAVNNGLVDLRDPVTNQTVSTARTDANGNYAIVDVVGGEYKIGALMRNGGTSRIVTITLVPGEELLWNIQLRPAP